MLLNCLVLAKVSFLDFEIIFWKLDMFKESKSKGDQHQQSQKTIYILFNWHVDIAL